MSYMRVLPFGARILDSFVKKLKWETARADAEFPGVLPCLCMEERRCWQIFGDRKAQAKRIDFERDSEILPINRLVPHSRPPVTQIRERVWVLHFNYNQYPPEATFKIDDLELHISVQFQAELKGATIFVVGDNIAVKYGFISF